MRLPVFICLKAVFGSSESLTSSTPRVEYKLSASSKTLSLSDRRFLAGRGPP